MKGWEGDGDTMRLERRRERRSGASDIDPACISRASSSKIWNLTDCCCFMLANRVYSLTLSRPWSLNIQAPRFPRHFGCCHSTSLRSMPLPITKIFFLVCVAVIVDDEMTCYPPVYRRSLFSTHRESHWLQSGPNIVPASSPQLHWYPCLPEEHK